MVFTAKEQQGFLSFEEFCCFGLAFFFLTFEDSSAFFFVLFFLHVLSVLQLCLKLQTLRNSI